MKVSAFSYVRNGFHFGYPFLQSIQSVLPLVDEFIVVVGDSFDGTREGIVALNEKKIKIVDTVWDEALRVGGKVFAQQANIGLQAACKDSDWLFHIQADEVVHEKDYTIIKNSMLQFLGNKKVDGLLFNFIHFFGDYNHIAPSRRFHKREIRIIRNTPTVRSYNDSMGFRKYTVPVNTEIEKGKKLLVKLIDATIYHYSYAKDPNTQAQKAIEFAKKYQSNDEKMEEIKKHFKDAYAYNKSIDYLEKFKSTHPAIMHNIIQQQNWEFNYNPALSNITPKEKFLKIIEKYTGLRLFAYKNYKII